MKSDARLLAEALQTRAPVKLQRNEISPLRICSQPFGANSAARAATLGGGRLARTEGPAFAHLADADRRCRIRQERLGNGGGAAYLKPPLGRRFDQDVDGMTGHGATDSMPT
jgi:hypothetical protein